MKIPALHGERGRVTSRALWIILTVALLLAAWGVASRLSARSQLVRRAASSEGMLVSTVHPTPGEASSEVVLPATLQPFMDAPVYARTSGYLRRWLVDIGAHVHKGQLLAEIDSPEVDQQLHQAQADLAVAEANSKLAKSTADRWRDLLVKGAVARQDVDDKVGDAEAKGAEVASARANLQRLQQLASFEHITAPFDGVITARRTDVGALIAAGTGAGTSGELFHIAAADKLRVYVNVPQAYASDIRVGGRADVRLTEQPERAHAAAVVSTADSIDPVSRTMLVQLELDASDQSLLAGTYVEVHLKVAAVHPPLRVPSNALLYREETLSVVTVTPDQHMKIVPVTAGRDFGTQIEVLGGLSGDDQVIVSPPESASDGMLVRVRKATDAQDAAPPPSAVNGAHAQ